MQNQKFYINQDNTKPYFFKNEVKYEINKNENIINKLAIVGSRSIKKNIDYIIDNFKYIFGSPKLIISGGANGVDKLAENWAKENNIETNIIKPDWVKYGKSAGFIRNEDIIKNCDVCLAIWDGESKGTKHDIDLCEKYQKDIIIFNVQECVQGTFHGFYYKHYGDDKIINQELPKTSPGQNNKYNRWLPQPGIINV